MRMLKTEPGIPERFGIIKIFSTNILESSSRGVMLICSAMKFVNECL